MDRILPHIGRRHGRIVVGLAWLGSALGLAAGSTLVGCTFGVYWKYIGFPKQPTPRSATIGYRAALRIAFASREVVWRGGKSRPAYYSPQCLFSAFPTAGSSARISLNVVSK
jgi:hypothetical protein